MTYQLSRYALMASLFVVPELAAAQKVEAQVEAQVEAGEEAPEPAAEEKRLQLDEIIVTAQKRSEDVQDVPLAVTASTV